MKNETTFTVGSNNAGRGVDSLNEKRSRIMGLLKEFVKLSQGQEVDKEKLAVTLDNI